MSLSILYSLLKGKKTAEKPAVAGMGDNMASIISNENNLSTRNIKRGFLYPFYQLEKTTH